MNDLDIFKYGTNADNRQFNVNGCGLDFLRKTLELAFIQRGSKASHWSISKTSGFVLHWCKSDATNIDYSKFPSDINFPIAADIIWEWLNTKEAKETELKDWDCNADHDGDNTLGWRVFCEDWGHVDGGWSAICAVKPAYLWHGK